MKTGRGNIVDFKGTEYAADFDRMNILYENGKKIIELADSIKEKIKAVLASSGCEFGFFGTEKGVRSYTTKPSVKTVVDEKKLSLENKELYERCLVKVFSPEIFEVLASDEEKKEFSEEQVTRKGAVRFDQVKKVTVVESDDDKGFEYDGSGSLSGRSVVGVPAPGGR